MGWEIAGGKKAVKKPVEVKSKGVKEAVKFPKQETLRKSITNQNTIKRLKIDSLTLVL